MALRPQNLNQFFKINSYSVALCGLFSLYISGGVGKLIVSLFLSVTVLAWKIEETKWQISEKLSIVLIFAVVPLFYIDWKFQLSNFGSRELFAAGSLARLILFLCVIKLLQKKSDRDWIFIYLIAFFEVLLAAGLSISPLYLLSLILFLLVTVCAIVSFEIRKTSAAILNKNNVLKEKDIDFGKISYPKILINSAILLILIGAIAVPLFFTFPRVSGAGLGGNQLNASRITGFSDSVKLGEIGRLLQNDETVMRVRVENNGEAINPHWRGVALNNFDGRRWSRTIQAMAKRIERNERNFFQVDYDIRSENLVTQTVYLEPISTQILFALSRPIALQGNFPFVSKNEEDSLNAPSPAFERISYKVTSDVSLPDIQKLRRDNAPYLPTVEKNYLQLPENLDERIAALAAQITAGKNNRYDKSKAVESYLQTNFGYTLQLKAGGEQPLADFLFNVREGHCEYFATAMAIMLRTQGIATRVVNGFQSGEYNETADVYVVKQKNAHSWVEVYFPQTDSWVPFDPTPFAGQDNTAGATAGVFGNFNKYFEALETFWIQYFVAYDNQEQRSLMRSVKSGFNEYQSKTSEWLADFQEKFADWWKEARGEKGLQSSAIAIASAVGYLVAAILGVIFLIWLCRKIFKLKFWKNLSIWAKHKNETTIIEFYERMQKLLASKGFVRQAHQTPLEFALAVQMPEAVSITEKYNRVRFGEKDLSNDEATEIEQWLDSLAEKENK